MKVTSFDQIRTVLTRCISVLKSKQQDQDLDEELRTHVDLAVEEHVALGMSRRQARVQALRDFGGVTQIRETYRTHRGFPIFDQIARDLRFGIRQLLRSPGFALTAILTLALGLGANTAVFSLINGLLLRPLPVPHAEQLSVLNYTRSDNPDADYSFSAPIFRTIEKRRTSFQAISAFSSSTLQVRGSSGNINIPGEMVSGQYFQVMQTPALMGRTLTPQDDQPGGATTGFGVVISEGFWRSWFNSAPDVVGRQLIIANASFTVVGVMPREFIGADPARRPEIYVPLWSEPVINAPYNNTEAGFHSWWMRIIVRRNPGVSLEAANAELKASTNAILQEAISDADWLKYARTGHFQLAAVPGFKGYSYLQAAFFKPLTVVFALCGAMLLLGCLNLASLLLARSAARQRELATRLAMGASRRRLIQQLMAESLLIALLGTAAGMIAAPLVSRALASLLVSKGPGSMLDTTLDLRVFLFVTLTAVVATLVIGLIPALRATSSNLNEQIKTGSRAVSSNDRHRVLPRILMGLEVALALILVVGAGLLASSLARLYRAGLGFEPKGLVNLSLDMGKQPLDGEALTRWYQAYADSLSHQPGVRNVSFASITPMDGSVWTETYHTPLSGGDREIYMNTIAPDFFETMRIPLLSGRDFQWTDTKSSGRKIILNQAAAKVLFPGRNPIGQQFTSEKETFEVVAVVGDIRYASIRKDPPASAYIPLTQDSGKKPSYTALVRVEGPTAPLADAARTIAARMAPEIPAPVATTMSSQLDDSMSSERMMAMLSVFFAFCALLVTAIGLYGTLAYATARRTSEIGIRMALGAQRAQVIALVFRENTWIAAGGSLAGLVAALLASRVLSSFLYGTSVHDPWVLIGSVTALVLVASAASLIPALRAARIEPMEALRSE